MCDTAQLVLNKKYIFKFVHKDTLTLWQDIFPLSSKPSRIRCLYIRAFTLAIHCSNIRYNCKEINILNRFILYYLLHILL